MKKNKMTKLGAAVAAGVMLITALCGCGGNNGTGNNGTNSELAKGEITYPIETDVTLKIWTPLNANVSAQVQSENELTFTQGLKERTGINVEFIHPPIGQEKEKFNVMLASGELPDIVVMPLSETSEGADALIASGYVKELDEDFMKDYAPNLWKKITEDKELNKWLTTNDGKYYGFPGWRESDSMTIFAGLVIREDLLEKFGLTVPETIDEWHNVLTVFKNNGLESPLSWTTGLKNIFQLAGQFSGAYGEKMDFYVEDGKVKYGPMQTGYKEFLKTMNQWYEEGLIDKNFASVTSAELDSKILNGATGATYAYIGGGIGKWMSAKPSEEFSLVAAPSPVLKKGDTPKFAFQEPKYYEPKWWISGTCENPELAARFLDYAYSEEGHMYYNFGEEGVSYTMEDGMPTYTELITNNPDGLSATLALTRYTHASYMSAFQMDERFFKQQYPLESQRDAIDVWNGSDNLKHYLTGALAISSDDASELTSIMTDINNYVSEMTTKYIMGLEDLSSFDAFVSKLKQMRIEEAIAIKQRGYDAFEAR